MSKKTKLLKPTLVRTLVSREILDEASAKHRMGVPLVRIMRDHDLTDKVSRPTFLILVELHGFLEDNGDKPATFLEYLVPDIIREDLDGVCDMDDSDVQLAFIDHPLRDLFTTKKLKNMSFALKVIKSINAVEDPTVRQVVGAIYCPKGVQDTLGKTFLGVYPVGIWS